MLHAVIMAGGSGTRFWPASRADLPKQLLRLVGDETMLQATVGRLGDLVTPEQVIVLTNEALVPRIAAQLPELPPEAIVGEPCRRDTAPCIGLAALLVAARHEDATMVVLPADHVIQPAGRFRRAVEQAVALVEEDPERLVTFGIRPTYPAESFGYIERGGEVAGDDEARVWQVKMFREKPTAETAAGYLEAGTFYWNAGIFVWKASTILAALREYEPRMYDCLQEIRQSLGTPQYPETLAARFAAMPAKSIDFAVMERHPNVLMIEAPFEWDDLGSWQSLSRRSSPDQHDNTAVGRHLGIRSHNNIVRTDDDHLVVTLGIEDCIVIHTPDATLVARRHDEESIRQVVAQLRERGWDRYL